jgi:FixJ family two-component response regulator
MKHARGQVYLVDDDPDICRSMTSVLGSVGYSISTFASAEEFLQEETSPEPHCLIADLLLPGMTGLKLCRQVAANCPACGFIVISGNADVASAVEAIRIGAFDFLEKPFGREKLLAAVHDTIQEVTARCRVRQEEGYAWARFEKLTARERDVFGMVAAGLPTKTIARSCGISTRTVDVHRSRILQKLQIESPTQLAHLIAILDRSPGGCAAWAKA